MYLLAIAAECNKGSNQFFGFKNISGQELATFRQMCEKMGLLEDINHWDATLEEAMLCRSPAQIRELFAILICTCGLSNPLQLWHKKIVYSIKSVQYKRNIYTTNLNLFSLYILHTLYY
jgi:hypothetical protein